MMRFLQKTLNLGLLALTGAFAPLGAATDFVFSSPTHGSTYRVGEVIRIQFQKGDTSVKIGKSALCFTPNDGVTWNVLTALNGMDSASLTGRYSWTIKDSGYDGRKDTTFPLVGDSCRVAIFYYEPRVLRSRSETFSVLNAAGVVSYDRKSFMLGNRKWAGEAKSLLCITPTASRVGTQLLFSVNGRELQRYNGVFDAGHVIGAGVFIAGKMDLP